MPAPDSSTLLTGKGQRSSQLSCRVPDAGSSPEARLLAQAGAADSTQAAAGTGVPRRSRSLASIAGAGASRRRRAPPGAGRPEAPRRRSGGIVGSGWTWSVSLLQFAAAATAAFELVLGATRFAQVAPPVAIVRMTVAAASAAPGPGLKATPRLFGRAARALAEVLRTRSRQRSGCERPTDPRYPRLGPGSLPPP